MLVELDRQQLGLQAERRHPCGRGAGLGDPLHDRRELSACRPNSAQERLVLGGRPEAEIVGERRRRDLYDGARDRPVDRQAGCDGSVAGVLLGEDLVVVPSDVLRLQQSNMEGIAPELAVRKGSLLERSQRRHSLVRLPEQA